MSIFLCTFVLTNYFTENMSMTEGYFNDSEKPKVLELCRELIRKNREQLTSADINNVHSIIKDGIMQNHYRRDKYGINPTIRNLNTAMLLTENIGPDRNMIIAILLYNLCRSEFIPEDKLRATFGDDIAKLISGLTKVSLLYKRQAAVESENFHKLLLTFAEDIRVIIIMIVDRLAIMRAINHHPNEKFVHDISNEAKYLYAPLAHRLGLYKIKSELEDLSFKYTNREVFTDIARKLNETKVERDRYIADFIAPVKAALEKEGLKFDIKGRTKSISSIWNKMKNQNADVKDIFDLFAIRIILDTPLEREKAECWNAYSIVTAMYTANTSRLKDWLTIPKSNGYESLHITVNGPGNKWVEVQIRTRRMDEIAERGLAAHWKYKGIKSEGGLDEWMNNVRDMLESGNGPAELMKNASMHIYDKEVFVFTPKGDLFKFPKGATVLDFAYHIHSKIGNTCTGARINNKVVTFREQLHSGDQIEILTSSIQKPKQDWLNVVKTSRAKSKIRLALKETQVKEGQYAKEIIERKFKNKKIDIEESVMTRLVKKLKFKEVSDFYKQIVDGTLDMNTVIEKYLELQQKDQNIIGDNMAKSADGFNIQTSQDIVNETANDDVLVIDQNLKGIDFQLARCCQPIYGDKVFGFVTAGGGIKIHREDCPNAAELHRRFPYRVVKARWSGKGSSQYCITLRVVGTDDIGIVNNLTSIISKEEKLKLRSISIDSNDGLFGGNLEVMLEDTSKLEALIKKLKSVKGVINVTRI